jgi:hypothetical protein
MTSNQPGAGASSEVDLYSYNALDATNLPNATTLTVPACTIAGTMFADIDLDNVEMADVYIAFVTDVSQSTSLTLDGTQTRLDVIKENITTSIEALFDTLGEKAHVGLVHYADSAVQDTGEFLGEAYEGSLSSIVSSYASGGGAETNAGIDEALALFENEVSDTTNIAKIIVLVSDGEANSEEDVDTSVLAVLNAQDIEVFTIALSSTDSFLTSMDRWSSNTVCSGSKQKLDRCDIDEHVFDPDSSEDYNDGNLLDYSYAGESATFIENAYGEIVESLGGATAIVLSSEDGAVTIDRASVQGGWNVELPWPSGFSCDGVTSQSVPLQIVFRGESTEEGVPPLNVSDVRLDYCAP